MSSSRIRRSSKSESSGRLPSRTKSNKSQPIISTGAQRVQTPQYSQPRQSTTMQEFQRASAQAYRNVDEVPSQGHFVLSSMDHENQYGHQSTSTQWIESPSLYVNSNGISAFQPTGRSLEPITTTDTLAAESQYYSCQTDSGLLTPVPTSNVDFSNGCITLQMDNEFTSCQPMPSNVAEVPMTLSQSQQFQSEANYCMHDYQLYSQPGNQENDLSYINNQDLAWCRGGLLNPGDAPRSTEGSPTVSNNMPLTPVSMGSSAYTPPTYTVLPAPMLNDGRPPTVIPDSYSQEFSGFCAQDHVELVFPQTEGQQAERSEDFYQLGVGKQRRCTNLKGFRTVKASKRHQRPLLSAALVKPPTPPGEEEVFLGDNQDDVFESRSNDDRIHPYYKAKPMEDGLYHCPFAAHNGCEHIPTQQKCSYDKYLDSHLKPYRCKAKNAPQCAEARFSSTACRLRHEREAHGLHGHGERPFYCEYDGCDRSSPDNGFPRRWNLYDHMKRVHNWTPPESECGSDPMSESPQSTQARPEKKAPVEKRRKTSKTESTPIKKNRSHQKPAAVMKSNSRAQQEEELRVVYESWDRCRTRIQDTQAQLKPSDADGYERIQGILAEMHTESLKYRRLVAGLTTSATPDFA